MIYAQSTDLIFLKDDGSLWRNDHIQLSIFEGYLYVFDFVALGTIYCFGWAAVCKDYLLVVLVSVDYEHIFVPGEADDGFVVDEVFACCCLLHEVLSLISKVHNRL